MGTWSMWVGPGQSFLTYPGSAGLLADPVQSNLLVTMPPAPNRYAPQPRDEFRRFILSPCRQA